MTTSLSLVVAGLPGLAQALESTGLFARVFSVDSTSGMRSLIRDGLLTGSTQELAFIFSDALTVDTPTTPLDVLLRKLTGAGYRVIVAQLTPNAPGLVAANPGAGLLPGPFTINLTLGALSGLGFPGLNPLPYGADVIDPLVLPSASVPVHTSAPDPVWAPPNSNPTLTADSAWQSPVEPAIPAPSAPAWQAPVEAGWQTPVTDAPDWLSPTEVAIPAPSDSGWQAPAGTPVTPEPGWQAPAPAPNAAPDSWQGPSALPARVSVPDAYSPAPEGWQAPYSEPTGTRENWQTPAPDTWAQQGGGYDPTPSWGGGGGVAPRPGTQQRTTYQRRGHVITVAAPKGGTGKSTLTLNLATYLGLRLRGTGKTVCVIDTNFQQADTGKYINQYSPNIIDIVKDPGSISLERLNSYLVHKPELNISCLLGPARILDANPVYINAHLYSQILEVLRGLYDYIFIDTPVAELFHDTFAEFALPQADFIVVPIAPSLPTLANADNWMRSITAPRHTGGNGIDQQKLGWVLNRAQDNIDCSVETARENLANWNFIGMIPETTEWQRANNNFELVATKNFHELNEAFSRILYVVTGEPALATTAAIRTITDSTPGFVGTLKRLLGRG